MWKFLNWKIRYLIWKINWIGLTVGWRWKGNEILSLKYRSINMDLKIVQICHILNRTILLYIFIFILAVLIGVWRYLNAALVYGSLMATDAEKKLSCAYLPPMYSPGWSVWSSLVPFSNWIVGAFTFCSPHRLLYCSYFF